MGTSKVFALRDFPTFGLPICDYLGWSLLNGEIPLWNPFSNCGVPFAAQWNTMVFYPPHWLAALASPATALSFFCLSHLFAAGLGMHRLARDLTGSDLAAALAGASFALHGLLVNSLMWPNNIAAFAWFPWLALATLKARRSGGTHVVYAGLIGGAQMLTGAPEVILFSWATVTVLVATDRNDENTPLFQIGQRLCGVVAITTGIAAVQLLPFMELLAHSERWQADASTTWAAGWAAWLRWVAPLFDTFATPSGPRFHAEQSWAHSVYGGILPLLVAGAAIRGNSRRMALALVATVIVSGICAHGNKSALFGILAGWLPLRFPVKLLIFQAFAFPLLAALGCAALLDREQSNVSTRFRLAPGVALTLILCLIAGVAVGSLAPERQKPAAESLAAGLVTAILFIALLLGVTRNSLRQGARIALGCGLLAAVLADLALHQRHLAPNIPRRIAEEPAVDPFAKRTGKTVPTSRATLTARAVFQTLYAVSPTVSVSWESGRKGIGSNHNLPGRIPKTGGFFSLNPGAVSLLEDSMYAGPNGLHRGLLELLAISKVMTFTNDFAWADNPQPVSIVRIGAPPRFEDPDQTLAAMREPTYSPRNSVFLQETFRARVNATSAPDAKVSGLDFTPHRIAFETDSSVSALVAVSQTWYPCWRASIDGNEAELWPADHAFMALEVPPGPHHVEIVYEDSSFEIGRSISLATLLVSVFALFRARKRPGSLTPAT
jgi:sorbitol-specific phosphotransferase system component IIC